MDYYFMDMKSFVNAQTTSEQSGICVAVKEDKRQTHHEQRCIKKRSRRTVDN